MNSRCYLDNFGLLRFRVPLWSLDICTFEKVGFEESNIAGWSSRLELGEIPQSS